MDPFLALFGENYHLTLRFWLRPSQVAARLTRIVYSKESQVYCDVNDYVDAEQSLLKTRHSFYDVQDAFVYVVEGSTDGNQGWCTLAVCKR